MGIRYDVRLLIGYHVNCKSRQLLTCTRSRVMLGAQSPTERRVCGNKHLIEEQEGEVQCRDILFDYGTAMEAKTEMLIVIAIC
jgi:hypothetical protein